MDYFDLKKLIKNSKFTATNFLKKFRYYPKSTFDLQFNNSSHRTIKVSAVGDVTLAHRFTDFIEGKAAIDFDPFNNVKSIFNDSITVINLENCLTDSNDIIVKKFNFKGSPGYIKYLVDAKVDMANIANNHIGDFGDKGIIDTINILSKANIELCGAGLNIQDARNYKILERDGIKIAFLGYDDIYKKFWATESTIGVAYCNEAFIKDDVGEAKRHADIVCVSLHFGIELDTYPSERQKFLARLAVDSGAHIVLGHHPHVIQGVEQYGNGIIFYSLGNFCFGGNNNPVDKDTIIPIIHVSKLGISKIEILPCKISSNDSYNDFTPTIMSGNEGRRIMQKLKKRSEFINNH